MKKFFLLALTLVLAAVFFSNHAFALTLQFGDDYFLGSIDDGLNPSEANETLWVNELITMVPGTAEEYDWSESSPHSPEYLTRSALDFGALPTAIYFDKDEDGPLEWVVESISPDYVLGKYGNGSDGDQISYVWYVGDYDFEVGETITIDNDGSLSHITVFNANPVPEPTTMLLFGFGLIGIAAIGKKKIMK